MSEEAILSRAMQIINSRRKPVEKVCPIDGVVFTTTGHRAKFCSDACKQENYRRQKAAREAAAAKKEDAA